MSLASTAAAHAALVHRLGGAACVLPVPAVHEALAKWAADDLRSLNSHIELLLRDALRKAGREAKAAPLRKPGRPSHESRE